MLAFPCNQFGDQEPGTNEEILEFAKSTYDVNFPMFAKVDVNGEGAHPLFAHLTAAQADEEGNADIAWNFSKFLVGKQGEVLARFSPMVTPEEIAEQLPQHL